MTSSSDPLNSVTPAQYQPALPLDRLILEETAGEETVPVDVLFVGGGPAGLAGAIELARLVERDNAEGSGLGEVEIGVLEKAASLGEHCLSGAMVNPGPFRELFPDVAETDFLHDDGARCTANPDAANHAQQGELRLLDLRDRPLDG